MIKLRTGQSAVEDSEAAEACRLDSWKRSQYLGMLSVTDCYQCMGARCGSTVTGSESAIRSTGFAWNSTTPPLLPGRLPAKVRPNSEAHGAHLAKMPFVALS